MKKLLRTLFGSRAGSTRFNHSGAPSTLQSDGEAVNRRQLALMAMSDVMRITGIPAEWIACETLNVSSRKRGNGLYIHLIVKHWDERLMRVGWAFQTEMKAHMERIDPKAAVWNHGISWQLDVAGSCPHLTLPDKSHWANAPVAPAATTNPAPPGDFQAELAAALASDNANLGATVNVQPAHRNVRSELTQDLEKLFAIRDEEMKRARTDSPERAGGSEQTQPAPLKD